MNGTKHKKKLKKWLAEANSSFFTLYFSLKSCTFAAAFDDVAVYDEGGRHQKDVIVFTKSSKKLCI